MSLNDENTYQKKPRPRKMKPISVDPFCDPELDILIDNQIPNAPPSGRYSNSSQRQKKTTHLYQISQERDFKNNQNIKVKQEMKLNDDKFQKQIFKEESSYTGNTNYNIEDQYNDNSLSLFELNDFMIDSLTDDKNTFSVDDINLLEDDMNQSDDLIKNTPTKINVYKSNNLSQQKNIKTDAHKQNDEEDCGESIPNLDDLGGIYQNNQNNENKSEIKDNNSNNCENSNNSDYYYEYDYEYYDEISEENDKININIDDIKNNSNNNDSENKNADTNENKVELKINQNHSIQNIYSLIKSRILLLIKTGKKHFPATKNNEEVISRLIDQSRACHEYHFLENRIKYFEKENTELKLKKAKSPRKYKVMPQKEVKQLSKELLEAKNRIEALHVINKQKIPSNSISNNLFDEVETMKIENQVIITKEKQQIQQIQMDINILQKQLEEVEKRINLMTQKTSRYCAKHFIKNVKK